MPIIVEKHTPTISALIDDGLPIQFGLPSEDAIRIAIVNLMPDKQETERHLLRQLAESPFMVAPCFIRMTSYRTKNTDPSYLEQYYKSFEELQKTKTDGLIITGAPLEHIAFEDIGYWAELKEIMEYANKQVASTLFICWAVIAGLYYHYGIPKTLATNKIFGVFPHCFDSQSELFEGFIEPIWVPQSRYFQLQRNCIEQEDILHIVSESKDSGIYVIASKDKRQVYVSGHLEYESETLKREFLRDQKRGLGPNLPKNYFSGNDPSQAVAACWENEARQFYTNWLKYYVSSGRSLKTGDKNE